MTGITQPEWVAPFHLDSWSLGGQTLYFHFHSKYLIIIKKMSTVRSTYSVRSKDARAYVGAFFLLARAHQGYINIALILPGGGREHFIVTRCFIDI